MSSVDVTITRVDGSTTPGAVAATTVPRGEVVLLGRYVVHEAIGRGGGGEVFGAYDPELDRKVAIKLVREGGAHDGSSGWTAKLRIEAQAIAKLSHPNIVAVHDVGEVGEGHSVFAPGVFIVMELVTGHDLTAWLEPVRPWRDVLNVLLPVGRALAAAHEARLVHRDVKPANILLGDDGRARLVDFGLARAIGIGDRDAKVVEGTPAMMAPEQHAGAPADARSDQYGWCATLHTLVHGVYPFHATSLSALVQAKHRDAPQRKRRTPGWLDDAIARGLAPDPSRRFRDMDELVATLERGRRRLARRATAGAALAVLAGTGAIAAWSGTRVPEARCVADGETDIERVWGAERRDAALAGIRATAVSYADDTAVLVADAMDGLLSRWRGVHEQACAAAFDSDRRSEAVAQQLACLERTLADVDDLATLWANADREVVMGAGNAADRVSRPEDCVEVASAPSSDDELEHALRRGRMHTAAGAFASARELADAALARARLVGDARGEARAEVLLCRLYLATGRIPEEVDHCELAALAAERSGDALLAIETSLAYARITDHLDAAEWTARTAEARLAAQPDVRKARELAADVAEVRSKIHDERGNLDEAAAEIERTIEIRRSIFGPEHGSLVSPLNDLGTIRRDQGRLAEAQAALDRALALTERIHGRSHPHVGLLLHNMSAVSLARGDLDEAAAVLERTIVIKDASFGVASPVLLTSLSRLVAVEILRGNVDTAWAAAARARAIEQSVPAIADRDAVVEVAYAQALVANERCADAARWLDAIDRLEHDDPSSLFAAEAMRLRGRCAALAGDWQAAAAHHERAVEWLDHRPQGWPRDLVAPLVDLAEDHLRLGDRAAATAAITRARVLLDAAEDDPLLRARLDAVRGRIDAPTP